MEINIKMDELKINASKIVIALGYKKYNCLANLYELIEKCIKKIHAICNIRTGYKIIEDSFALEKQGFYIDDQYFKTGSKIASCLKGSKQIALFIITAGEKIEKVSKELYFNNNFIEGYLYDYIGSEIVESAADKIESVIKVKVKKNGYSISNRYSPGYCGWDVAEQHKLFSFLPKNFCGVKLTDSSFMIPQKSISGVIGIGEHIEKMEYGCNICNHATCSNKKIKKSAGEQTLDTL